jgi:hypothetical protein
MKKAFLIITITMLGFATTNAFASGLAKEISKGFAKPIAPYSMYKARAVSYSIGKKETATNCTVTLRLKIANADVTMNFVGATCADAWAAAKKTIERYQK